MGEVDREIRGSSTMKDEKAFMFKKMKGFEVRKQLY